MKQKKTHWTEKVCSEMEYGEFVKWATTYALDGFMTGGLKGLTEAVEMIVSQAAINEKFGGRKKS